MIEPDYVVILRQRMLESKNIHVRVKGDVIRQNVIGCLRRFKGENLTIRSSGERKNQ